MPSFCDLCMSWRGLFAGFLFDCGNLIVNEYLLSFNLIFEFVLNVLNDSIFFFDLVVFIYKIMRLT